MGHETRTWTQPTITIVFRKLAVRQLRQYGAEAKLIRDSQPGRTETQLTSFTNLPAMDILSDL